MANNVMTEKGLRWLQSRSEAGLRVKIDALTSKMRAEREEERRRREERRQKHGQ